MNNTEIERKWLLSSFPPLPIAEESYMEQGYLSLQPNTVRIRKTQKQDSVEYWLTIKGQGTIQRVEVETKIDELQYQALQTLLLVPIATKKLRTYHLQNGDILECSLVDEGQPTAFYYAEVEFENLQKAESFIVPEYLGKEVTYKKGYTMAEYCADKIKKGC